MTGMTPPPALPTPPKLIPLETVNTAPAEPPRTLFITGDAVADFLADQQSRDDEAIEYWEPRIQKFTGRRNWNAVRQAFNALGVELLTTEMRLQAAEA